ncbi:cingulin [Oryzias latipes]|uniref:Cingulin b n=1 Tax=Oryzias latipes TaxID=8090 RepID=H2L477_ORYLA|nr:cingulin [Oryzias latipes]XP_023815452.1 cingulin [Oryzias latipes]XP_023815453.1 cingulin [Oryzias latipes]
MSTLSSDRKPLVDYGVQIRFIKDLHDTGGGFPDKSRGGAGAAPPSNKYGVAVRVQGISGQPYVVLKDGDKGDSYGVQLTAPTPEGYSTLPKPKEPAEVPKRYSPTESVPPSPAPPVEDEEAENFGSPLRRPPGDGQAGTQGDEERGGGRSRDGERPKPEPKATFGRMEKTPGRTVPEEYNEAGLKPVWSSLGPRKFTPSGPSLTSSLGRYQEKKAPPPSPQQPRPEPPAAARGDPAAAIDTNSLAPINKLISKFNSGTPGGDPPQTRGRSGARQRLNFDERTRSRSLDARKNSEPEVLPPPSSSSVGTNEEAPPPPSSFLKPLAPVKGSVGNGPATVAKETGLKAGLSPPEKSVAKETVPATKPVVPSKSFIQNADAVDGHEGRLKHAIYGILKDGSSESEASLRRKVDLVCETTDRLKRRGSDGIIRAAPLEEQLQLCRKDLQQTQNELSAERKARDAAESRLLLQEDQLAQLQEELRRVSEFPPQAGSTQTDVMVLQGQLAEVTVLHQRQEEVLHQRERELTALKGALKEEVECHDREMECLREQYSQDMENLRRTMEQFTQSQEQIEEERERVNASVSVLEEELESCKDQGERWRTELQVVTEQLKKSHLEKKKVEEELKDLQDSQPSTGKDSSAETRSLKDELRRCHDDLKQTRAHLDRQKAELEEKNEALGALKKASGEKEAELQAEIRRLKEQSESDKEELEKALERANEASSAAQTAVDQGAALELQETNLRLRERLARMSKLPRSSDPSEELDALEDENRALKSQLEDAKRGAGRLAKERDELSRRLEERELEREVLKKGKVDLEEQKRQLDRALEKITKEMEMMMADSRQSVATLQTQLDDFRERSRKELLEAQRNAKDRQAELQRAQAHLKGQQEEVSRLKKELLTCSEDRDGAQLERDLLSNRLKHLESELESERSSHSDRSREIRGLEDKIKTLEIELDEERNSVELLNDRITRSREQVDQLRSELMQERSARHDLEMDKSALERQVKELKSRLADMEGQARPSAGLSLLETKLQETEDRLRSEEREKATIQASLRRTERKLKDVTATLDQERSQHVEQRDQLSLRVKGLKRQVDESESEVERLEGVRRKILRELEEQQELQEALQAKVTALENEQKRKSQLSYRPALSSAHFSSEEEEDGFPDSSLSSLLHESSLQTSSC